MDLKEKWLGGWIDRGIVELNDLDELMARTVKSKWTLDPKNDSRYDLGIDQRGWMT